MFFSQYLQENHIYTSADILNASFQQWSVLATEAGIDANQLSYNQYTDGLFKAAQLPALTKKDKYKCYLFVATKTLRCGLACPILVFGSFRHGGIKHVFNSAKWLWQNYQQDKSLSSVKTANKSVNKTAKKIITPTKNIEPNKVFLMLNKKFNQLDDALSTNVILENKCPWLTQEQLCRVNVKSGEDNRGKYIIAPLEDSNAILKGYQRIYQYTLLGRNTNKDFSVCQAGAKKGSFIKIHGDEALDYITLCEGLTTALAICDIEPSPIYVALDAGNLLPVSKTINKKIRIYADNDCWKPKVGNTGLKAASEVAHSKLNTQILLPPIEKITGATDYNDLRHHLSIEKFINIINYQQKTCFNLL